MSTEDNGGFNDFLPDQFTDITDSRFWRCPLGPGRTLHSFDTRTNTRVNIKCIDFEDTSDKKSFLTLQAAIWHKLMKSQHRFVLPYDGGISGTGVWLAYKQYQTVDLLDFWEETQSSDKRMLVILEMLVSVNALHKSGLVHGDLKVSNLLVHFDDLSICCVLDELLLSACRNRAIVDSNKLVDSRFRNACDQVVSTLQDEYAIGMICELLLQQSPDFEQSDKDLLIEVSSIMKSTHFDGKSSRLSTCIKKLLIRCNAAALNLDSAKFETPGFWNETFLINNGTIGASLEHSNSVESYDADNYSLVPRQEASDIHPHAFPITKSSTKFLPAVIVSVVAAIGFMVTLTQFSARNKASELPTDELTVTQPEPEESSEQIRKPEPLPEKKPEATEKTDVRPETKAVPTPSVTPNLSRLVDVALTDAKSSNAEAIRASSSCELTLNRMTSEVVRDESNDILFTKVSKSVSEAKDFVIAANNCFKETERAVAIVKSSNGKDVRAAAKFARTYADRTKYFAKKAQTTSYEATALLQQALQQKSNGTNPPQP